MVVRLSGYKPLNSVAYLASRLDHWRLQRYCIDMVLGCYNSLIQRMYSVPLCC